MSSFFSQPGWNKDVFKGTTYRYLSIKPASPTKPTLLLLHGFPSGPQTFRAVIPLFTAHGYGVITPELLGYGETDKPTAVSAYARKKMSDELLAILDKEGVDKVIAFGHDHGGPLAHTFVRTYPARSTALILACVAFNPHAPGGFIYEIIQPMMLPLVGYENFGCWPTFLSPGAPKLLEDHIESYISITYAKDPNDWKTRLCPPGALEENLLKGHICETAEYIGNHEQAELAAYLKKGGLAGPLKWYAATASDVNDKGENALPQRLALPYLFLQTNKDVALPPILASNQAAYCDDLTVKEFETGHWLLEEDPKGAVDAIVNWIDAKGFLKAH